MLRPRSSSLVLLAVCLTLFVAGCGGESSERPSGSVAGTVTLGGQPFTSGTVNFYDANTGNAAMAELDGEGKFAIPDMVAGNYAVYISPPAPTPSVPGETPPTVAATAEIPAKYLEAATSGFVAEVKNSSNSFEFPMVP